MAREIVVLWAGRHLRRGWDDLCGDYRDRVAREVPVSDRMVKVKTGGQGVERQREEARALREALPDPAWTVALDPRGKTMSSEKFGGWLRRRLEEWPHALVFLLGSDLGLDPSFVRDCRTRLSFGPMVYGHELARLVLWEQLYRGLSMARGIDYHRRSF